MVGWHHWLNEHEFEETLKDREAWHAGVKKRQMRLSDRLAVTCGVFLGLTLPCDAVLTPANFQRPRWGCSLPFTPPSLPVVLQPLRAWVQSLSAWNLIFLVETYLRQNLVRKVLKEIVGWNEHNLLQLKRKEVRWQEGLAHAAECLISCLGRAGVQRDALTSLISPRWFFGEQTMNYSHLIHNVYVTVTSPPIKT